MNQTTLFAEDIHDALRDVVRALGGNKEVGHRLRPELPSNEAGTWLKDCLNPERRERLNPEQVLWLLREGRRVGCHSAINFVCDECGYSRATPIEPIDEAAELQRRAEILVKELGAITKRLERVGGLRSVA